MATVLLSKPSVEAIIFLNRAEIRNSDELGSARLPGAGPGGAGQGLWKRKLVGRCQTEGKPTFPRCGFRIVFGTVFAHARPPGCRTLTQLGWDASKITIIRIQHRDKSRGAFVRRAKKDNSGLCRVRGPGRFNGNHPNEGSPPGWSGSSASSHSCGSLSGGSISGLAVRRYKVSVGSLLQFVFKFRSRW